ncbi:hypothetical protein PVL29_006829 [Vitis rotundifolia]|uniref:NB-ARC domain-containing protein n=1 Tax=Vitis rotundifolia TaxID=103349 RepID=A0AA39DXI4_VITRO|nr:hypothetical protein PVL29_006829 [Vitis rotundifolia]
MIVNILSRCENMVDNELKVLSSMTKGSTEDMFKSVESRVVDKLLALLHHQPTALLGVEEEVDWIERELRGTGDGGGFQFTEELVDVAYDLEDVIDNLLLKSEAEASGRGSLEDVTATDDDPLHNNLSDLPASGPTEFCLLDPAQDTEETASPDMNQHTGVTALLAQKALHPEMKVARRVQDKFRLMIDFLKVFESGELDNRGGTVWMEELLTVSCSAVDVMEELINKREQLRRSWMEPLGRVVFDFYNFKSQNKLALEICKIYIKIVDISNRRADETMEEIWYEIGNWIMQQTDMTHMGKRVLFKKKPVLRICTIQRPQDIEEIDWSHDSLVLHQTIANAVVSPVIEKVAALLAQEALPPRVEIKARRVQDKFRLINDLLRDLESVEFDDSGTVSKLWIDELCQVSRSTEDVIDQFLNSREQIRSCLGALGKGVLAFGHLISQHKLIMKMDQISAQIQKQIQNLSIRRQEGAHVQSPSTVPRYASSIPQPPTQEPQQTQELDAIGFDDDVHAIMTRLLSDDTSFSVISIVGVPGIGKTTLAKSIYNNKAVVDHFPFRAWTSVTWEFLAHIMRQEICLMTLEEMRHKFISLLAGKRCLIVFDDASNACFFNLLVTTFSDASNGSRLILTTRSMSLPSQVQRSVHHAVRLRGNDESWALFTHALKVNMPQQLLTLRREIERTCGGLPLAIIKLANLLSQKGLTIEEWCTALQQLNHDQEQLWSYHLSRINKDLPLRSIALWVAEGLVQAKGEDEAPEDVAERCLIKLIAEGMVQVSKKKRNGNIKTCCLPSALRQYWLSKAQETTFLQIHKETTSHLFPSTGMISRLADHLDKEDVTFDHIHGCHDHMASSHLQPLYQQVVSFLSFDTREGSKPGEDMGNFLHRCISGRCLLQLRVLDLENVFKPKLPEALGKLNQLRYLGLRSTFLDMLPSFIKKLHSLQVLDVKHTNITTLPNPVLVGLLVDEETPVKDGLDRFVNLRKLGLTCRLLSSQQEAMVEWVLKMNRLRSLRLESIDEQNQAMSISRLYLLGRLVNPSIVPALPHSLIDITLSGSELKDDPMQTLDKLPNLKILRLLANSYTGKNMHCSLGGFSQLRVLKLWKLEQLE